MVIAGAETVPAENVATPVAPRVVKLPAAAVLAPTIPSKLAALIRPLTPKPPVITAVPVVVDVLAVPAVKVVAPLLARVVNAPVLRVVAPTVPLILIEAVPVRFVTTPVSYTHLTLPTKRIV